MIDELALSLIQAAPTVTLAFLPFYHAVGLQLVVLRSMLAPFTYVIMPRWDIDVAIEAISKYVLRRLL